MSGNEDREAGETSMLVAEFVRELTRGRTLERRWAALVLQAVYLIKGLDAESSAQMGVHAADRLLAELDKEVAKS